MSLDAGTCEWLVNEIDASHLQARDSLEPILVEFRAGNPYADATAFAEYLLRREQLTTFQATRLLEGSGRGLVLGPYILADAVGAGSMGTVYRALGRADRKAYALKVLPARAPWNIRQARRRLASFPTEPHPGVIPFLDVGTSAGQHYLVWPFESGETLEELVRRDGLMQPARAATIGMHLAQALHFCEQNRVYHGLVKPSNILIAADGQAKLLDFGVGPMLAEAESSESLVDTLSESNTALNMLDCLCPEAIVDPGKRSIRGDQYGLGCSLYFALTGRYPFPDGTAFEKMAAHQSAQPTPVETLNHGVPAPLARVIERLMQKSPELRYNNLEELIEALHSLARPTTTYAPPSLAPPSSRAIRGPTTTPMRSTPTLLSAIQPRPAPPAQSPVDTPAPRSRPIVPLPVEPVPLPPRAADVPPPSEPPAWQRWARRLAFWKRRDAVACTLLTPPSVLPGESTTLQVVVHTEERTSQAKSLPDWRGTETIGADLHRGAAVELNLDLKDISLSKPVQHISWAGFSAATLFNLRVPEQWPVGEPVRGTLAIRVDRAPVARLEFTLPVGAAQSSALAAK